MPMPARSSSVMICLLIASLTLRMRWVPTSMRNVSSSQLSVSR